MKLPSRFFLSILASHLGLGFLAASDCNDNGLEDAGEIQAGLSEDCNRNGLPDACDLTPALRFQAARSYKTGMQSVPERVTFVDMTNQSELLILLNRSLPRAAADCDGNGAIDSCDLAAGRLPDADHNGVPDVCEISLFRRGDAGADGTVTLSDPIATLNFLFLGAAPLVCPDAADWDDNGLVDLTDAISSLNGLFLDGGPPAPPGFGACGPDTTPSTLGPCLYPQASCR